MSTLPTRQARIVAVALHIGDLKPEGVITHEQIREELKLDTGTSAGRTVWYAAVKRATLIHRVVLRSIRGVGYARLTDAEVCDDESRLRRVREQAKRGLAESMTVDPTKVGQPQQSMLAAKMMVLASVVTQAKPSAVRAMGPPTSPGAAMALVKAAE